MGIVSRYPKLSRLDERQLIKSAQRGNKRAIEKLLLSHIGFFKFRIKAILFPGLIDRYGDDMLQECLLLARKKISTFDLLYRDKQGRLNQVYFRTYLWKAVTGLILNIIKNNKHEIMFSDITLVDVSMHKNNGAGSWF